MSTEVIAAYDHVDHPKPLGLVRASETALFIASPLLSAGALSLIGVVCADAEKFQAAGPSLLLLVMAVIALLLSIQLGYHARQWIYSYDDLQNWTARQKPRLEDLEKQATDYAKGRKKLQRASMAYNAGTVLLAFGVALVLVPHGHGGLAPWRWASAGLVSAAAVGEAAWTLNTYTRWRYWFLRRRAAHAHQTLQEVEQHDA